MIGPCIDRLESAALWDLIYPQHMSILPQDTQEIMRRSIMNSSRVWAGSVDDKLVCCWGLIPPSFLSDTAYLWLYTTEQLHEHVFVFIRQSQRAVEEVLKAYPIIVGHCDTTNPKAIRWLHWLGARFGDPQGRLIPFRIER
jgi:hypothetical protein